MTECTKSLQRVSLRRSIWRKCLLAGSVLLAMSLFFSCQPNVPSGGNSDKTYTVNHNFARVESGYDVEKEELSGPVDSETKAAAKQKDGFELDKTKHTDGKIAQATIKADGSTVVDIYYARKEVTLTFKLNGGKFGESTDDKTMKGKFGEPLVKPEEPKLDGHTFTGWEPKLQGTFPAADTTYTAKWAKGELPKYTVNHWQQDINSETGTVYDSAAYTAPNYTLKEPETKHGYTGEQTQAEAKTDYEGFELDKNKHPDGKITQVTINANGSAVVDIYYVRKEVTLTFKLDGGKFGESTDDKTVKGKYGETKVEGKELKDYITKPEKDGMQFAGWNTDKVETPASFPSKDTEYTAQWTEKKAGSYTVKYLQQNIEGDSYTEKESVVKQDGIIGEETAAAEKNYTGFHLSTNKHKDGKITQQKIEAGSKTVVNIYYDRDTFTVTFKLNNGSSDIEISNKRYETPMDNNIKPQNITPPSGKVFDTWEPSLPPTITKDATYTAVWKDAPPQTASYKVEHWLQKINPATKKVYNKDDKTNGYVKQDSNERRGTIGQQTDASAITTGEAYSKYTALPIKQQVITADGTTVVKIYYVRKEVTLTFKLNGGKFGESTDDKTVKGRYGETIQEAEVGTPEKDDAVFDDWKPLFPLPGTCPETNEEYTAQWKTVATLELKKAPDKTIYNKDEELNLAGLEFNVKYAEGGFKLLKPEWITGKYGKYTVSGFSPTTTGEQTVTVTYKKATLTFKVTVQEQTPPSQTFAIGDIIDKDRTKYKIGDFNGPASGKTWKDYYVIIAADGTKYVGVQYIPDGLGYVFTGTQPENTYAKLTESGNRYLTKEEVEAILGSKERVINSIKATGCDKDKDPTVYISDFTDEQILYTKNNGTSFFNGKNNPVGKNEYGTYVPIAAKTFE